MLLKIYNIMRPITTNPKVQMVALYRVDGTPIIAEVRKRSTRFLNILYNLENNIKNILYEIFNGKMEEVSFKFKDVFVKMYPVSKTIVLTVITSDELSLYRIDVDVKSICRKIRELI